VSVQLDVVSAQEPPVATTLVESPGSEVRPAAPHPAVLLRARTSVESLKRRLFEDGSRFDFFQALRLIERVVPHTSPLGHGDPAGEAVFLHHDPTFSFHTSDISSIDELPLAGGGARMRVTSTFLGLVGATSPLAYHYAEPLTHESGQALRHFYDLIHHRLLSLFYRVRQKYRPLEGYRGDGRDSFSRTAFAFLGVDVGAEEPAPAKHALPLGALLALAPLVSVPTRSPRTLRLVLEQVFPGLPIEVECFVPRQVEMAPSERCQLGVSRTTLGQDLVAGDRMLDCSGRFRIRIGPLPRALYQALVSKGARWAELCNIINFFSRGLLEAEVELVSLDVAPGFWLGLKDQSTLGVDAQFATDGERQTRRRFLIGPDAQGTVLTGQPTRPDVPPSRHDTAERRGGGTAP
jgi:type VI secretion system protein ImpH